MIPPSLPPPSSLFPEKTRHRWKKWFFTLSLTVLVTVAITVTACWFLFRGIQPTNLTEKERHALETKLSALSAPALQTPVEASPSTYNPGGKFVKLTARELNGLLNEHTDLGQSLKFEFAENALHARLNSRLPDDSPILAGKKIRGKARFVISDEDSQPSLILDDVTIWGISLPNNWLGGLKNQDLLSMIFPENGTSLVGVKRWEVTSEGLLLELDE